MSKLIKAVFTGRFCRTQRVFQFDTDDKLQIVNVDLPANYTVDFSNSKTGDSVSVLATSDTVQIPPDLFVPGSEIYAWIWLSDSNGGHTRCEATIPIDPRARRTGTEPTPAQASAWDEAVDTLNETIDGIPAVVNAALTDAKESGEFDGEDGEDGNGVWYVDVQYTRTISAGVQAQLDHMVGRPGATPAAGDLCVVSDGRFGAVTIITPRVAVVPVLGDLSGKSAYELAVEHGYEGTEAEWLENLQGEAGFAPEVTIETITGGTRIAITSAAHPEGQSFDVMNGSGSGVTVDDALSGSSTNPVQNKVVKAALDGKYSKPSGGIPASDLEEAVRTSLDKADDALPASGNAYRTASIPMGHLDSTSTATVMTATIPGITELRDGVCVWLRNGVVMSAYNFTLNINGLGAKPCYSSLAAASRSTTTFSVNYTLLFVYNSTRVSGGCWDIVYGVDTTYSPPTLGFGYGTCTTAAATAAKVARIDGPYALTTGGIVAIKFDSDVPAGATLIINSKIAKAIYYKGAAITDGVIKAGDTVTMIYSTYYHVLSIDRDVDTLPPSPSNNDPVDISTVANAGSSTDYARADHMHRLDVVVFESILNGVSAVNVPVILYDGDNNGVVIQQSPQNLANIQQHQPKMNFALVVPPNYNNYPVLFTVSKFDATTGELHLTGITGGVLYEATLLPGLDPIDNEGIAMVGTLTQTNLALPSAQGVSF